MMLLAMLSAATGLQELGSRSSIYMLVLARKLRFQVAMVFTTSIQPAKAYEDESVMS